MDGAKCHYNGDRIPLGSFEGKDCDYEHSTCQAPIEIGQITPGQSNSYCYTLGTGVGPSFINNIPQTTTQHDMKDSTDIS